MEQALAGGSHWLYGCCSMLMASVEVLPEAARPIRLVATPGSDAGMNVTAPSSGGRCRCRLRGEQRCGGGQAPWNGARWCPCVECLVKCLTAPPAMGLPSTSSRRSVIWRGCWRRRLRLCVVPETAWRVANSGPRAEGGEGDALGGAVEAGGECDSLALGERAHGDGVGGDAVGVGERDGGIGSDVGGGNLPDDLLASGGKAVGERERLDDPGEGGSGGERERRAERGENRRRSPGKLSFKA